MFNHILVPIDGSDCSLGALDVAAQFARDQRARLSICTVVDPAKAAAMAFGEATMAAACLDALDEEGKALLEGAAVQVRDISPAEVQLLEGPTVESIIDYAKTLGADMLVIGSHGRTGLPRLFLGSVAEGVLRHAAIPVMVVRQVPVTQTFRVHADAEKAGKAATSPA